MLKWFHHLFNPHCEHCREEYLEAHVCDSCNTLRQEIIALRKHNEQLIQSLLEITKPKSEPIIQQIISSQPVNKHLSWPARRQMMEAEDKKAAEILRKKREEIESPSSIEKLEEELEINALG